MNPLAYAASMAGSLTATTLRGGRGVVARPALRQPEQLLVLYDFEGCPHCRLVREVLTELDIDALIQPCPKGGERFRPALAAAGGKLQVPFLVDPNTATVLYEAAEIISYLFERYDDRKPPLAWQAVELQRVGSQFTSLARPTQGIRARPSLAAEQPLELFSFEASPFARPVRELLCELELPYTLRSVGRTTLNDWIPPAVRQTTGYEPEPQSRNRQYLKALAGSISIPYLIDPNQNESMAESRDILAYLECTYAIL